MRLKRFLAILHARNLEFVRDRSSLGWNILLPVLLVLGLAVVFGGQQRDLYKVGLIQAEPAVTADQLPFLDTQYIEFVTITDRDAAIRKVGRHQLDMLLDLSGGRHQYWVNTTSPKGYMLEKVLKGSGGRSFNRQALTKAEVPYVDWVMPGILGMNMMFSCLFGVGYVIVRYRKSGYLKRLNATPLLALEFITAQLTSRLILIMLITSGVYLGTEWLIGFEMQGNYLTLLLIAALGAASMVALGLLVAARVTSEELAGGLLNVLSWPMMLLSGVWFSLEGSNRYVQWVADIFPLTHMLKAARAVMIDGAGLVDVLPQLAILAAMSVLFVALGAWIFRWRA